MAVDLKSYWQEQAKKAGLSDEQAQAVLGALGDEKVAKAFAEGFVTRSDYSRDLDRTRDEWKGKVAQYDEWYNKQALPTYQQAQQVQASLAKYRELYGDLTDPNNGTHARPGLSREEVAQLMEERERQRDAAYNRVAKTFARASADYMKKFGDVLDVDGFEEFAVKRGGDPWDAYNAYIAPKVQEQQTAFEAKRSQEVEDRIKREREEAVRDYASKHHLPAEVKKESFSPLYDQKAVPQGTSEREMEHSSRNAFVDGWSTWQPEGAKTGA